MTGLIAFIPGFEYGILNTYIINIISEKIIAGLFWLKKFKKLV